MADYRHIPKRTLNARDYIASLKGVVGKLQKQHKELEAENAKLRQALGDAITFREGTEPYEDAVRLYRKVVSDERTR